LKIENLLLVMGRRLALFLVWPRPAGGFGVPAGASVRQGVHHFGNAGGKVPPSARQTLGRHGDTA
jgi:hypothetical protein